MPWWNRGTRYFLHIIASRWHSNRPRSRVPISRVVPTRVPFGDWVIQIRHISCKLPAAGAKFEIVFHVGRFLYCARLFITRKTYNVVLDILLYILDIYYLVRWKSQCSYFNVFFIFGEPRRDKKNKYRFLQIMHLKSKTRCFAFVHYLFMVLTMIIVFNVLVHFS